MLREATIGVNGGKNRLVSGPRRSEMKERLVLMKGLVFADVLSQRNKRRVSKLAAASGAKGR